MSSDGQRSDNHQNPIEAIGARESLEKGTAAGGGSILSPSSISSSTSTRTGSLCIDDSVDCLGHVYAPPADEADHDDAVHGGPVMCLIGAGWVSGGLGGRVGRWWIERLPWEVIEGVEVGCAAGCGGGDDGCGGGAGKQRRIGSNFLCLFCFFVFFSFVVVFGVKYH